MTTSWAYAVRGRWLAALDCNIGGTLLAAAAITSTGWLGGSAALGRWLVRPPSEAAVATAVVVLVIVTVTDWIYRLWTG